MTTLSHVGGSAKIHDQNPVKIHSKSTKGWEIFIFAYRFDTAGSHFHFFSNHNHAKNFVRYLFSQSKAHQPNHLTLRNTVCTPAPQGGLAPAPLANPSGQLKNFMAARFPKNDADRVLFDDGAYVDFALLSPDGEVTSNMISWGEGNILDVDLGLISQTGGTQEDIDCVTSMLQRASSHVCFDDPDTPIEMQRRVDSLVQNVLSKQVGGRVVMSVSHRDQLEQNNRYHIHRLLERDENMEMTP